MAQDYYKILGVDKKATQDEIKSQYRKLVKQYHPDLHPNDPNAAAKFKEINEANEILSDPQKRQQYDYELENPFASRGGFGGFSGGSSGGFGGFGSSFSDIFGDIFSQFSGDDYGRSQTNTKGQDLTIDVSLSFLDAVKGCSREVSYSRREPCSDCKGTGAKGGTSLKTCDKCHGSGKIQYTSGSGFFRTVSVKSCPDCNGTGKKIIEKCSKCSGKGYSKVTTNIKFDIPAGADSNSYIKKRGMGDASLYGGEPGDLYIKFNVQPHKMLLRKNFDLYVEVPITFATAVLGGSVEVPGIDGTITLPIPEGTTNGKVFTLRGKGIKSKFGNGNLYVTVNIEVPTRLNKEQKQIMNDFANAVDVKQCQRMAEYSQNVQSLYGTDPYKR